MSTDSTKEEVLQAAEPAYRTVLSLLTPDDRQAVEQYVEATRQSMIPAPQPESSTAAPPPQTPRSSLFLHLTSMQKNERWRMIVAALRQNKVPHDFPQCVALAEDGHWHSPQGDEVLVFEHFQFGPVYPLAPPIRPGLSQYNCAVYIANHGVPSNIWEVIDKGGKPKLNIFGGIANRHTSVAPRPPDSKPETPAPKPPVVVADKAETTTRGEGSALALVFAGFIMGGGVMFLAFGTFLGYVGTCQ